MNSSRVSSVFLACLLPTVACSSEQKKPAVVENECGLHTRFAGDENCIAQPAVDEGLQIHVGPKDYDDPNEINATGPDGLPVWLMTPGAESSQCYRLITDNPDPHYYFKQKYRMRKGSHHMIVMAGDAADGRPVGWWHRTDPSQDQFCGNLIGAIGGTERIVEDLPPGGIVAPEDEGLGRKMDPNVPLDLWLHFYNSSDQTYLREAWVNYYYIADSEFKANLGMLGAFTRMESNPTPGARSCTVDLADGGTAPISCFKSGVTGSVSRECPASSIIPVSYPARVVTLFGHGHTHNRRFAVWHLPASGGENLVYDSYQGAESPTFTYNSVVQNPLPDPVNRITGASSGQLLLGEGDKLKFQCDIVNDTPYDFYGANEVNTDEMCHLFGSVVGLGFACFNLGGSPPPPPPPDGGVDGGP